MVKLDEDKTASGVSTRVRQSKEFINIGTRSGTALT